jgi:hypothetical protein
MFARDRPGAGGLALAIGAGAATDCETKARPGSGGVRTKNILAHASIRSSPWCSNGRM